MFFIIYSLFAGCFVDTLIYRDAYCRNITVWYFLVISPTSELKSLHPCLIEELSSENSDTLYCPPAEIKAWGVNQEEQTEKRRKGRRREEDRTGPDQIPCRVLCHLNLHHPEKKKKRNNSPRSGVYHGECGGIQQRVTLLHPDHAPGGSSRDGSAHGPIPSCLLSLWCCSVPSGTIRLLHRAAISYFTFIMVSLFVFFFFFSLRMCKIVLLKKTKKKRIKSLYSVYWSLWRWSWLWRVVLNLIHSGVLVYYNHPSVSECWVFWNVTSKTDFKNKWLKFLTFFLSLPRNLPTVMCGQ